MRNTPFQSVELKSIGRSVFDLSHYKLFSCDMSELIPILVEEVIPGDVFQIGNSIQLRFRPLIAPILHEINVYVHYFFVPYRLIWSSWEDFITGGEDGSDTTTLPYWNVTTNNIGSLWDYLGFPIGVDAAGARPIAFPQYAYNQIYNDYYRDQNLVTELALTNETLQKRAREKDYFTSALASQEKGTVPAISMTLSGVLDATIDADPAVGVGASNPVTNGSPVYVHNTNEELWFDTDTTQAQDIIGSLEKLDVDVDISAGTVTGLGLDDLRLNIAIKRWMELNNRVGSRYVEYLKGQYGASPRDDTLQRARYLGGSKTPVTVSEVLQTSETNTTEQGTMVGHAMAVGRNFCARARINEFGLIMGMMSVMPRTMYSQGIDRMWSNQKDTRYDYFNPLFEGLAEQPVYESELYCDGTESHHETVFGYQGRYNEYRARKNMVAGDMRSTFDHWHLGTIYSSRPQLNQTFIEDNPRKDIFASSSDDGLLVECGNIVRAIRPMRVMPRPGRI